MTAEFCSTGSLYLSLDSNSASGTLLLTRGEGHHGYILQYLWIERDYYFLTLWGIDSQKVPLYSIEEHRSCIDHPSTKKITHFIQSFLAGGKGLVFIRAIAHSRLT